MAGREGGGLMAALSQAKCCYIPEGKIIEEAERWIRANAGYFGTIGDDPEKMALAFREQFAPSGCTANAEYEIHGRTGQPDDYTHACTEHVGELLTDSIDGRVDHGEPFRVFEIDR